MSLDLELTPKSKRAKGERCCEPVIHPDVERDHAVRMAEVAKALGDPIRLQLVDVLRKHAGKVCVCGSLEAVTVTDNVYGQTVPSAPERLEWTDAAGRKRFVELPLGTLTPWLHLSAEPR